MCVLSLIGSCEWETADGDYPRRAGKARITTVITRVRRWEIQNIIFQKTFGLGDKADSFIPSSISFKVLWDISPAALDTTTNLQLDRPLFFHNSQSNTFNQTPQKQHPASQLIRCILRL